MSQTGNVVPYLSNFQIIAFRLSDFMLRKNSDKYQSCPILHGIMDFFTNISLFYDKLLVCSLFNTLGENCTT